jgi:hypothetical protein
MPEVGAQGDHSNNDHDKPRKYQSMSWWNLDLSHSVHPSRNTIACSSLIFRNQLLALRPSQ